MAIKIKLPFFNRLDFFLVSLRSRCGPIDQKILVVEMVVKIKVSFSNDP